MLVITRKNGEGINIGDDIKITVLEVSKDRVRIGIDAPKTIKIARNELADTEAFNIEAAGKLPQSFMDELLKAKKSAE